jgi:hypothetical protein
MLIEIAKAVLFGIVQGITEWLPISSTGHMILLNEFVTMNMSEKFMEMFFVVVQLGAILAVLVLFGDKLLPFSLRGGFRLKAEALALWRSQHSRRRRRTAVGQRAELPVFYLSRSHRHAGLVRRPVYRRGKQEQGKRAGYQNNG